MLCGKWSNHAVFAKALSNFSITNASPCLLFIQVKGSPLDAIGMRHKSDKICWNIWLPAIACSLKVNLSDSCKTWLKSPMQTHRWFIWLPNFWSSVQMRCRCSSFGCPYMKVTVKISPCMFLISEWMKCLFCN